MKILLALMDGQSMAAVADYAAALGHEVDCADSDDIAERNARFRAYDAVLCDASFNGSSCLEGLRVARAAKRRNKSTRVIVLATRLSSMLVQKTLASGIADAILIKPQPLPLIFDRIANHDRIALTAAST